MGWKQPSLCVLYSTFIYAFVCTVLLLVYIHFSTLPHCCTKPATVSIPLERNIEPTIEMRFTVEQNHDTENLTSLVGTESMEYTNLIPIMDFKDLGHKKRKLLLLIIVSTAPGRFKRRQGIRETWWKNCQDNSQVKCLFVTDGFIMDNAQRDHIIQERSKYKDIELQPLQGWEFGLRFLSQIRWVFAKFDFKYFLRIDDDYFLCLKRLLAELPWRPKQNLIWGSFHCEAGITWIDESFMIFTPDIIDKFLSQNESTMLCHVHADQQIGIWLNDIPTRQLVHDSRLHHKVKPASFSSQFINVTDVCDSYLGIHGTYADKMRYFGVNSNDSMKVENPFPDFSTHCKSKTFDYRVFGSGWKYQPKLCKDNPRWDIGRTTYIGRENQPP